MRVVIDRKMWKRGNYGYDESQLYDPRWHTHNRCCLGFLAQAAGITDVILAGAGEPSEAYRYGIEPLAYDDNVELGAKFSKSGMLEFDVDGERNTPFVDAAISINDGCLYANETDRETDLIELFEDNGHELHFIN